MDKQYNLSRPYGEGVRDLPPSWMEEVLHKLAEPKVQKPHPFWGIDDPILNPQRLGVAQDE